MIGGSAGSLEALEQLLAALPARSKAAFIVTTHRDPRSNSGMMANIIGGFTAMPVKEAHAGMRVEPGYVYVTPPSAIVIVKEGRFGLSAPRSRSGAPPTIIDTLIRSVAEDARACAVGIILSGMGSDGSAGIRALKAHGGLSLVQSPESAAYDGMPRSAIDTGAVDVIGPVETLAEKLLPYLEGGHGERGGIHQEEPSGDEEPAPALEAVLDVVRSRTGHDFSQYKHATIVRRIERRMALHHVANLRAYAAFLESDTGEVDQLVDDLLIGVTRFFRDPKSFDVLARAVVPRIREALEQEKPLRVWCAGCASGEEAYSVAIVLREVWQTLAPKKRFNAQIYATDLDKAAVERARRGRFPASIAAHVSPGRLAQFFIEEDGGGYRITPEVRESIVFATQNIISDPPFTQLDVLSCRNVLIYMTHELQRKLVPLFFYALRPGGVLMLGTSESVDTFGDAFSPIDKQARIFTRHPSARGLEQLVEFPSVAAPSSPGTRKSPRLSREKTAAGGIINEVERSILDRTTPPVVVVDARGELVYASQGSRAFFEQPTGKPSTNVFTTAKKGLGLQLRLLVKKALTRNAHVTASDLRFSKRGQHMALSLAAWPIKKPRSLRGLVMVTMELAALPSSHLKKPSSTQEKTELAAAVAELRRAKKQLGSLTTEMNRSREAHESTNEELQSTNEELQSTNEELTTSKEEMQSLNEELLTLNAELQQKNEAYAIVNDDMRNLLDSTQIPTLFLDDELRLKRYTAQATRIANLIPTDVGRPITDIVLSIHYDRLADDVEHVLRTLASKEVHMQGKDGSFLVMRIHPYRTMHGVIDGVVITFLDVSDLRRIATSDASSRQLELLESLLRAWPGIAWLEDASGRSLAVSEATTKALGYERSTLLAETSPKFWRSLRHRADRSGSATAPGKPFRLRRKDGGYGRYVEETIDIVSESEGRAAPLVLHLLREAPAQVKGDHHGGETHDAV